MTKHRPRYLPGLLITGLLHVAIFFMFMHGRHAETPRADRDAIQWLLPLASPTPPVPRSPPRPVSRPRRPPPEMKMPSVDFFAAPPVAATKPADSTPAPASLAPPAAPDDPFAKTGPAPARPRSADEIMQQAKRDVRAIDAELRKAYPERGIPPPLDTRQARLERGINAAHDAVGPKWYQPARIVEISPKDAKTRTYKIITAVGAYCINISEDGKKSYTLCP